ncbi:MAG: hypothetical protein H0V07_11810, partial [Propionibacteriales bacterium]|nr:hypothetical protein [Propionibacteriales bacterium]
MSRVHRPLKTGYDALLRVVVEQLREDLLLERGDLLLATTSPAGGDTDGRGSSLRPPEQDADSVRVAALVDLAREGDSEAFGQLFD